MKRQAILPHHSKDRRSRKLLWIILLVLTSIILAQSVSPSPDDPLTVQSIYIFGNLSFFTLIFYCWMLVLLILLFTNPDSTVEKLFLGLIFALVFIGFWGIVSPHGWSGDGAWQMAHVDYLTTKGSLSADANVNFDYYDFPGFHFIGAQLQIVSGENIFITKTLFLMVNMTAFVLLAFSVFRNLLSNARYATLAIILAVVASVPLGKMSQFHPATLAMIIIMGFCLLMTRASRKLFDTGENRMLFTVLLLFAIIEYIFTGFYFFFLLLGTFLVSRLWRQHFHVGKLFMFLPLFGILFWMTFWCRNTFAIDAMLSSGMESLKTIISGDFLYAPDQSASANIGQGYLWWGKISRLLWWSLFFGGGTLLALFRARRFYELELWEKIWLGGLLGTLLMRMIGGLGTPGAVHGGISRYFWVAPIFITPLVIHYLVQPGIRNYAIPSIFTLILLFSLPMFLTNMDTIGNKYIYPQEIAAEEQLHSIYGDGEDLQIFGLGAQRQQNLLGVPESSSTGRVEVYGLKEDELWEYIDTQLVRFSRHYSNHETTALLFISEKTGGEFWEFVRVPRDDPHWLQVHERLGLSNLVFDNGFVRFYGVSQNTV